MIQKFRAWDNDNEVFSCFDFTDIEILRESLASFSDYFSSSYFKNNPGYLQQSTGLFDKNGIEIYSGDIIKYPDGLNKIGFADGSFVRYFVNSIEYTKINKQDMSKIEVIGNIFEDKSLLVTE